MLPILQIGPLAIQFPGLILLIGVWLGLSLAEKFAPQRQVSPNHIYNLVFTALITGVIGARLAYILRYPQAFIPSPLSALSLNPGLLDPLGGAAAGILASMVYGQRKKLPLWAVLDSLTPFLAVLAIAINLSNFASGAGFGAPTHVPWGIELWDAKRHPTQIYESLAAAGILLILWPGRPHLQSWAAGRYFLIFLASSSLARLFLEAFRGESILLPGGIRLAQIVAWLVLAFCLFQLQRLSK
jgi:prolipoprotein diacylglyceryl transferase